MSALKDRLVAMIRTSGPISVAAYMDLCLHDRQHGYYATRPGLGSDFITSPEISQIFGELLGLWAAHEWQTMGSPEQIALIEIGPGRGTLMTDALRAAKAVPGFTDATRLHFVEQSPVLRERLSEAFEAEAPVFLDQIEQAPTDTPLLILANEWLDCLPAQQYARVGEAWHERVIGLTDDGELAFGLSDTPAPFTPDLPDSQNAFEWQPGLKTLAATLQDLAAQTPCRALFIDYGTVESVPGDTLRSYQNGEQTDPLPASGASDLTCDVDFSRLHRLATEHGLRVHGPVSQSQFLLSLGAEARLNQLARQNPNDAEALYRGVKRLVDPADMGERFQVMCLSAPDMAAPAAF